MASRCATANGEGRRRRGKALSPFPFFFSRSLFLPLERVESAAKLLDFLAQDEYFLAQHVNFVLALWTCGTLRLDQRGSRRGRFVDLRQIGRRQFVQQCAWIAFCQNIVEHSAKAPEQRAAASSFQPIP